MREVSGVELCVRACVRACVRRGVRACALKRARRSALSYSIAGLSASHVDGRSLLPLLVDTAALNALDRFDAGGGAHRETVPAASLDPWDASHATALDASLEEIASSAAGSAAAASGLRHLSPPAREQLRKSGSSAAYAAGWRTTVPLAHFYYR